MNYFDIYYLLLNTIALDKPSEFQQLLNLISDEQPIQKLRDQIGSDDAIKYLQDILETLIDEGLVIGRRVPIDGMKLFSIERLSPTGYLCLQELKKPTVIEKLKNHAKQEGLAPTPTNITKLAATLLWD